MSTLRVAVYGSLKREQYNHVLLKDAKFLCQEEFKFEGLRMVPYTEVFPACVLSGDNKAYPFLGEVYEIDESILRNLDMLEGYPNFYDRVIVPTVFGEAWLYYLKKESNKETIYSWDGPRVLE